MTTTQKAHRYEKFQEHCWKCGGKFKLISKNTVECSCRRLLVEIEKVCLQYQMDQGTKTIH